LIAQACSESAIYPRYATADEAILKDGARGLPHYIRLKIDVPIGPL
jgi:hypothetical protein